MVSTRTAVLAAWAGMVSGNIEIVTYSDTNCEVYEHSSYINFGTCGVGSSGVPKKWTSCDGSFTYYNIYHYCPHNDCSCEPDAHGRDSIGPCHNHGTYSQRSSCASFDAG